MTTQSSDASASPRRRRYLQFSMRTLLMFMLVPAIGLSLWSRYVEPYRRQGKTIGRIEKIGGKVTSVSVGPAWAAKLCGPLRRIDSVNLAGIPPDEEVLRGFAQAPHLRSLDVRDSSISDAQLKFVGQIIRLEQLSLCGTRVTDAGLAQLENLAQLEDLDLAVTRIRGSGLSHLRRLGKLKRLNLRATYLRDGATRDLRYLTALEFLDLSETRITDRTVGRLKGAEHLQELNLQNTLATSDACKILKDLRRLITLQYSGRAGTLITAHISDPTLPLPGKPARTAAADPVP